MAIIVLPSVDTSVFKPNVFAEAQEVSPTDRDMSRPPTTIDDLIRQRADDERADEAIISYPSSGTDYVDYTPRQLNRYVSCAAAHYQRVIPARACSAEAPRVIALLGVSNLDYLMTFLAVSRLGHTVLFLSTRISDEAYISLLAATQSTIILCDAVFLQRLAGIKAELPDLSVHPICARNEWDHDRPTQLSLPLCMGRDLSKEESNVSWIIHSSGSTGLPKPIYQTHRAALGNYALNFNLRGFITLPLYHAHGLSCLFRAIYSRKQIYIYNASLPLTAPYLIRTLKEHSISIFYGVPYALKLLAETDDGIKLLSRLEVVMFGGSACPKPIGDKLVAGGVHLISHYGTTETGQLMTSKRDRSDKAWDYVRVPTALKPFICWDQQSPGIFELRVLDGWPSKVATNRDDGSYATKDLFEPHPTIPDAWRYYARHDDTLVLEMGEKANPLLIEGVARDNRFVSEAVVFGDRRSRLGLFLVPSNHADGLSDEKIIESVWPAIEKANSQVSAFAKLSSDMIRVLSRDATFRKTDKGTVIRAAFYRDFKDNIGEAYIEDETNGTLKLEGVDLLGFLRSSLIPVLSLPDPSILENDTDLFSLGMDSLQAAMVRKRIVTELDLGSARLGQNFVFEYPSLEQMEAQISRLRSGYSEAAQPSIEERMSALIERYSNFERRTFGEHQRSDLVNYVVTGVTGSLGAHIATRLAALPSVSIVYCLVRAPTKFAAATRVRHSLQERRLYHTLPVSSLRKIQALPATFSDPQLGLDSNTYAKVTSHLAGVIHSAWSVNFNYSLESFEKDCIAGTRNLINLCLSSSRATPAHFNFCSSVSAVAATPGGSAPEALPASLSYAQNMGYARSKLVTENICIRASQQTGLKSRVLRVGQIIGDTKHGVWSAKEAIPLMFQSAQTIGALPALHETPSWLPVDVVAQSIVEIAQSDVGSEVMNVVNHNTFHWTNDLIPLLHKAGLQFEEVSQREWVARLRNSNKDPSANPPIKLLEFFANKYDRNEKRTSLYHHTDIARRFAPALNTTSAMIAEVIEKSIEYFRTQCWSPKPPASTLSNVIIFAGPCGSGKSTAAARVSTALNIPMIEGDRLHSPEAIKSMNTGKPLSDDDRWAWLERVREAALQQLGNTSHPQAVAVACSALKPKYRDALRKLKLHEGGSVRPFFVLLSGDAQNLKERVTLRHELEGHYMKADMVDSQLEAFEKPMDHEVDVVPVDTSQPLEEVLKEVLCISKEICEVS